ncbi:unnamed protein product [Orchesella dallaii]|uniref:Uncharacterized protein n=1 Tax=Orchesella dallaii TaxID=48710 RepID=A0ABP1S8H6_9HEXA
MNSHVAPLLIPTPTCSVEVEGRCWFRACFTRRNIIVLIATVEMLGSLAGMCVYGYAAYVQPSMNYLVPIPQELCNAKDIVRGVMCIFILLCSLEFFLSIYLLEAARQSQINRLRFWLCFMLTYVALVTVVIIGMEFGGIRSPTMNAAAFINIFLRFMEILIVYVYVEQETMKMKRLMKNAGRLTESNMTIASHLVMEEEEDEEEGGDGGEGARRNSINRNTLCVSRNPSNIEDVVAVVEEQQRLWRRA